MDKAKIENYLMSGLFILPVLVFIGLPAHAESGFDFWLNSLVDQSIFADGYYKPPRYPFAARVVNAFSVVYAAATGIIMGIWRRDSVIRSKLPKNLWLLMTVSFLLCCAAFWLSITPQEFKVVSGRSFGSTENFHNNPVLFLFLLLSKSGVIYAFLRTSITYSLYLLSSPKKAQIKNNLMRPSETFRRPFACLRLRRPQGTTTVNTYAAKFTSSTTP